MHGFVFAAKHAFDDHRPLAIAPHHVWLMILQAVADHVSLHADELRSKWVRHSDVKGLTVERNEFRPDGPNDWASVVDGFVAQLRANTAPGVMSELMIPMSTATSTDRTIWGMTSMHLLRHYFDFTVVTQCGIPRVRMDGTREDWTRLFPAALFLVRARCMYAFAMEWLPSLLALLKKLETEYATAESGGMGDEQFWNTICKSGGRAGSGDTTWIDGWVNVFLPYRGTEPNTFCRFPLTGYRPPGSRWCCSWDRWFTRPRVSNPTNGLPLRFIPKGTRSVPVTWKQPAQEQEIVMTSGFVGIRVDEWVSPVVGWYLEINH